MKINIHNKVLLLSGKSLSGVYKAWRGQVVLLGRAM